MRKPISKYLVFLFLLTLSLHACQKLPEIGPEPETPEGTWTQVHYRTAVRSCSETKATLDAIDRHYLFEEDDRIYVVDKSSEGDQLYGFLYLVSGAEATEAVFEGDLMYFVETSSGSYEPQRPAKDLAVSATLVSKAQRDAGVYTIEANNEGKIESGPNFGASSLADSFKEAVQKYSTFTAEGTYGDTSFSLEQGTAFLLFALSFEDDVTTELTVSVTNNDGALTLLTHTFTPNPSTHDAKFVAAFPGGSVTLSNARLRVTGTAFDEEKSLASTTLQSNRYYNVVKTFLDLQYFTIQAKENTTISFPTAYQNDTYGLQYRKDGGTWTNVSSSVVLASGESIALRGKGNKYNSGNLFASTGSCYIYGDIMSLFCDGSYNKKTAFANSGGSNNQNALYGTFKDMTNLDIHPARPLLLSAQTLANACYQQMFAGSGITRAPEFCDNNGQFAATIPQSACKEMFKGCTGLLAAPELPATTVEKEGYYAMFAGCTAMATPPTHLASTMNGTSACRQMFLGCSSLTYAPELPALEVKANGYQEMFSGCTSLRAAPDLPATTIGASAYQHMFGSSRISNVDYPACTSMVTGPASLPATVMGESCYANMFRNCMRLEAAPRIDATTLAVSCFREMFFECHALRTAQDAFAFTGDIPQTACYRMFYNCLALNGAPKINAQGTIAKQGCKEMFSGCGEMRTAPASIKATAIGEEGCQLMFYNCVRLLDAPTIAATNVGVKGCQEMFRACTRLQNPPATLPAETLGTNAYCMMFYGCSTLNEAPALPATSVPTSAYQQMFYNCTSLTTPPALPATTLGTQAYQQMFYNCTSLTSIPSFPATAVNWTGSVRVCYQMFQSCTSLTQLTEPLFSGTSTLSKGCFEDMFSRCSRLATVPDNLLPATTLAVDCYRGMFQYSALTRAPFLLVETLSWNECYRYMFYGCKSLTYIKCLAANPGTTYTTNFTGGSGNDKLPASGTFVKKAEASWPSGANGIPSGWTVKNYPDE